ncbi:MBL fold metallo-hydrolase [Aliamphritea ceti]|uniref:MBL fold metallo-hydrolase n=1 Tax=Aliamphritea ceti TaxID=1524258 RepID=UPI0021C40A3A|nr:MBL fold metallo-hydrolase [Aliamphritea ceti]
MKAVIITFFSIFLASCITGEGDVREQSSHFKEGEFNNYSHAQTHTFWEIVWTSLTTDFERATWPEQVNTAVDESPLERVDGDNVRITFINHATLLVQSGGYNILTDPVFSERASPVSFIGPKRVHKPGIALKNLPKIDAIVISHNHYDHFDLDSVNTLIERDTPQIFTGLGVSQILENTSNVTEMDWGQSAQVDKNFKLWFLDVQHNSGRSLTDRNTTLWGGFLFEVGKKKIYFGGDTGYADHYKRTFERFGSVDVAFLPLGAYSPRIMFKPVHLNPDEAVQAHKDLNAKVSIGMHFGTFQLSAEPRNEPVELLERAKLKAGIAASSFITLDVGVPYNLSNTLLAQADRL